MLLRLSPSPANRPADFNPRSSCEERHPLYYTADEIKEKKNRAAEEELEYFQSFGQANKK